MLWAIGQAQRSRSLEIQSSQAVGIWAASALLALAASREALRRRPVRPWATMTVEERKEYATGVLIALDNRGFPLADQGQILDTAREWVRIRQEVDEPELPRIVFAGKA